MNEMLWLGFALLDLSLVLVMHRLYGKVGLFALIVLNLIICNIQVLKLVNLFGMTTTLGNILYASVFLSTDLLGEFYGKKEAQKGVLLGFCTLVIGTVYMQIALRFVPAADDFAQPHMQAVFGLVLRVTLASLAAYLISQLHDVWAFHFWKKVTKGKHLWIRNNLSTGISQLLDTAVFCSIAFVGMYPMEVLTEIFVTTYLVKLLVGVMDTPFIYLAKRYSRPVEA